MAGGEPSGERHEAQPDEVQRDEAQGDEAQGDVAAGGDQPPRPGASDDGG